MSTMLRWKPTFHLISTFSAKSATRRSFCKTSWRTLGSIITAAAAKSASRRLTVGNTGRPMSVEARAHIFERFHRGVMGENIPGYGLGLNLARELARLHQGDLRLVRSDQAWTEFEVRFKLSHIGRPTAATP